MSDVRLGVKFLFVVDTASNLAIDQCIDDGRYTNEKIVLGFFLLNALVEFARDAGRTLDQGALSTFGDFVPHEDADRFELLPVTI